jgi:hypothetical protein
MDYYPDYLRHIPSNVFLIGISLDLAPVATQQDLTVSQKTVRSVFLSKPYCATTQYKGITE